VLEQDVLARNLTALLPENNQVRSISFTDLVDLTAQYSPQIAFSGYRLYRGCGTDFSHYTLGSISPLCELSRKSHRINFGINWILLYRRSGNLLCNASE
jgi:hypothetical protein